MSTYLKRLLTIPFAAVAAFSITFASRAADSPRIVQSLDSSWQFNLGDAGDAAAQLGFNDSSWRTLDVPHDWSIEGQFDRTNRTGGGGGFLPSGVGWYRKSFTLPANYAGGNVFIEFDGVMANSDVWINGQHLGRRPYGYVSFSYELTPHLQFGPGKTNVIAVRADNSQQPASRWYTGAGIYRHVRLVVVNPVHVDQWGFFVSTPTVSATQAVVRIQTTVTNQSAAARRVNVEASIAGPTGRLVVSGFSEGQLIEPGASAIFSQEVIIKNPALWGLDKPSLYTAIAKIREGKIDNDASTVSFGVRDARFEADTGFWLNGKNFKIKGVCLHHDGGGVGAAVPLGVWERRLTQLKELGCNAIRTAHNPPAPEFLDLCDRMGFIVMDEMFDCWTVAKNPYDYHLYFNEWSKIDTADTLRRDRNHPSIVVYSVGNEIHDTPKAELAKGILTGLVEVCHATDPTRPVSQGLFRPNVSHDYDNGLADLLDVIGQNYRENEIIAAHEQKPTRKILGTENSHDRRAWIAMRDSPPYAGQFLWSGIDYLGEGRQWPTIGAASGLLDRAGFLHSRAWERQSWWSETPVVRIARRNSATTVTPSDPGFNPLAQREPVTADWSPAIFAPHNENVEVYSNCDDVELFLNGKSLGSKPKPRDDTARVWVVQFAPGTIKALGKNKGRTAATQELRTAGLPVRVLLTVDQTKLSPAWDDVAFVTATIVDEKGVAIPEASDLVTFQIGGPGVVAAVDNGDNLSHEPFKASERKAFHGRCLAIVKATDTSGRINVKASAPGLLSSAVTITATKPPKK